MVVLTLDCIRCIFNCIEIICCERRTTAKVGRIADYPRVIVVLCCCRVSKTHILYPPPLFSSASPFYWLTLHDFLDVNICMLEQKLIYSWRVLKQYWLGVVYIRVYIIEMAAVYCYWYYWVGYSVDIIEMAAYIRRWQWQSCSIHIQLYTHGW